MYKRLISICTLLLMLFCQTIPAFASSPEIDWSKVDTEKIKRTAYIHASSTDPDAEPDSCTNVYAGEDVNVYAAVDAPNKGESDEEYQYNLNSYVVKFYFDPAFFDLVYSDAKTHANPSLTQGSGQVAINSLLPFQTLGLTFEDAKRYGVTGWSENEMDGVLVDYTDRTLPPVSVQNIYGKDYMVVQGVFVLQGEKTFFPESGIATNWYNLCNITLRPKSTAKGSTEVMVETGAISSDGVFELIPKHKAGYPYTFKDSTTVLYGGYHQIVIGDTAPVHPPVPDKEPGYYIYPENGDLTVHLTPSTEGSEIFYTLDTSVPRYPDDERYERYDDTKGIQIPYTSTVRCYARKLVNGSYRYSYVMDYNYFIEPPAPRLYFDYDSADHPVPYYYYTDNNRFSVYATDKQTTNGMIANIHEIYYTFSPALTTDDIDFSGANTDPDAGWVKLSKMSREIEIDKTTPVRLVTVKGTSHEDAEFSSISLYMLYITPAPVTAEPSSNPGSASPFDVTLTSESIKSGAEIWFTTDGSDPRTHGIRYEAPIKITKNTTIRAVTVLNGVFSVTAAFDYLFDVTPPLTVSAVPYPGEYYESVDVYLTAGGVDDIIYYTTDGSIPDANSLVYDKTKPIHIEQDTKIQAVAVSKDGNHKGDLAEFRYTILPEAPVIVPSSTQFNDKSSTVTIFKPHPGDSYLLYYTTDGTDPRTSSTRKQTVANQAEIVISSSTVVNAVIQNSSGHYSKIAAETYEVISGRPVRPETTLRPGVYVYENNRSEPFTTSFYTQPDGVTVYYTIGYGEVPDNPQKGADGTFAFQGEDIPVTGNTIIKAIAVDENGKQSDLGIFYYTIVPEGPQIPESTILPDIDGVLLPVKGIDGSTVHYTIGKVENTITLDGFQEFWIDPVTGKAYADADRTKELGNPAPADAQNNSPFTLTVYAELDGVKGDESKGTYTYIAYSDTVLPPYASVPSGSYDERAIDENQNGVIDDGENTVLKVHLYCLTEDAKIYYYDAKTPNNVQRYNGTINLKDDCAIYMYAEKNGVRSSENLVFYKFIPLPPVIRPVSGIYSDKIDVELIENPASPKSANHTLFYRKSTDIGAEDTRYLNGKITLEQNTILKAYTVKDYNIFDPASGIRSEAVYEYYLFPGSEKPGGGKIYVNSPFDSRHVFAVNELLENPCSQGITLNTASGYFIRYQYDVTLQSGESYSVPENTFRPEQSSPIYPSISWDTLKITAWLEDEEGNLIADSLTDFHYRFVVLNKPVSSLAETDERGNPILYTKGTQYQLINEYQDSERNIKLFYTTDGSDPTDPEKRKEFKTGDMLSLRTSTTLRAVYMETCDGFSFFGPEAKYIYAIKSTTGGGGGGGSGSRLPIDNTRKYTKDIFGNEHPTHIGYINGYPDGSVRADGKITREEIAAVLYRVKNKTYDTPVATTGKVFPDVTVGRWSVSEIEYLAHYEIIQGYPDGTYQPEQNLTRAEFAALVRRFAQLKAPEKPECIFPDVSDKLWAYEDILAIYDAGLINGYEDGTFRPENEITRAEVMSIINRILDRKPDEEYIKTLDFNPYTDLELKQWYYVIVLEATITHNYYLDEKEIKEYKWEDYK